MQLVRFAGVGGVAAAVHLSCASIAFHLAGAPPQLANLTGFLCAVMVSYLGQARFTFGADLLHGGQFLRFVATALGGLAVSSATVWLLAERLGLGFVAAMAAVAVLVPAASYLAMRLWVFRARGERILPAAPEMILAALVATGVGALLWGRGINHDVAWYLSATRDWIGGRALYTDLSEVNPPLNFYLTRPAIWLADTFATSDSNAAYLWLALLLFGALWWGGALLRADATLTLPRRLLLLAGMGGALIAPVLRETGQREQVMAILMLPWLLGLTLPKPGGRAARGLRAVPAAVGMCLKPYFVLFPLVATLWQVVRQRSLAPVVSVENAVFATVGLAYVGFVALLHPAYFTQIVPDAKWVYAAYRAPLPLVALVALPLVVPFLLQTLLLVLRGGAQPGAQLFGLMSLAGLGSYLVQSAGFPYHLIPLLSFGVIASLMVVLRPGSSLALVLVAVVAVVGLGHFAVKRGWGFYQNPVIAEVAQLVRPLGPVGSLKVISSDVAAGPVVALDLGMTWASRYPADWLVPGAIDRIAQTDCALEPALCAQLHKIAEKNRTGILADLTMTPPDLLLIDRALPFFHAPGFSWARFMAEDARWAKVMAAYRPVPSHGRFEVYLRRAPAQRGAAQD